MIIKKNKLQLFLIYFFPFSVLLGNFFINLVIFFSALYFLINKKKIKEHLNNFQIIIFIFFLLVLLFSSLIISTVKIASFLSLAKIIISFFFALFIADTLSEQNKFKNYIKFLSFFVLIVALDGWVQFIFGKNILGFESIKTHGVRLTGVFRDEAVLGSFISKLSLIVYCFFYFVNNNKYYAIAVSIFIILSTIITNERMSSISVLIGFTIFNIYYYFLFSKQLKFLIIIPLVFLLVFSFIKHNNGIYYQFINKTNQYVGGFSRPLNIIDSPHGAHWVTAYKIFKNNLFIGSGLKNFRVICSEDIYSSNTKYNDQRCSTHPHNFLMEFLSETGIIGTALFIIFILSILFKKIFFLKNSFYFSIFLSLALYLSPLATSGSFFSTWNGCFFWFFLGLLLSYKKILNLSR